MRADAAAAPLEQARFYLRREMTAPEVLRVGGGEVVVFSRPRQPARAPNEDAAAVIPIDRQRTVLLLADGMGGAAAGDRAAALAITRIAEHLMQAGDGASAVRNALLDGIEEADLAIRRLDVGAGTTLVAVELAQGRFRSYHAGDSLALVIDAQGRLRWRTPPHSPVGHAIEAGLLDEASAMSHGDRHLLSNALGKRAMHLEVGSPRALRPGETLLLGSDGLFDNLRMLEIGDRVRDATLAEAAEELAATAAERMRSPSTSEHSKRDDLTFLAYRALEPDALGTLEFPPVEDA